MQPAGYTDRTKAANTGTGKDPAVTQYWQHDPISALIRVCARTRAWVNTRGGLRGPLLPGVTAEEQG